MIFDKMGTLTTGQFVVIGVVLGRGYAKEQAFTYAAALEQHSEYLLARAFVTACKIRNY